jgi:hypothetical protein
MIANGHSANDIADITHSLLSCFGIYPVDISSAINDNTNGAVLAGKYIVGNLDIENMNWGRFDVDLGVIG